jgi:hypothetical protein
MAVVKILVINQNADARYLPYDEQYQLFSTWPKAMEAAKRIGWSDDGFAMGITRKIGVANVQQSGDVKIMVIALAENG